MGDMAEVFNDMKAYKKKKRASNTESSTEVLKSRGVDFESKNNSAHLVVTFDSIIVDFWPSTGKWISRSGRSGRGVFKMLKAFK